MIWQPNYTVSNKLLLTIRAIGESLAEIKALRLSDAALVKSARNARALSAYASTSIEGNPLSLIDVKRLLKTQEDAIHVTEREVLNYNHAQQFLCESVRSDTFELNVETLEQIQGKVVAGLMDNPVHGGALREAPVVIRDPGKVDEVVFMPPNFKNVRHLVSDLMAFTKNNIGKVDPVILAGIFHRQCMLIHPFIDGSGPTTRLLTTAILGKAGFDLFEIFSFEGYYNRNITRYFKAVWLEGDSYDLSGGVDFSVWLEFFADGIQDELRRVRKVLSKSIAKPRQELHHQQILD